MPGPIRRVLLILGLMAALAILALSAILSPLFGGGWGAMGGIALAFTALFGLMLYRLWRRFAHMTRGGDPALRRRGVELAGRIVQVNRVPLPLQSQNGPAQTLYAVRLRAEGRSFGPVETAGFRTLDVLQPPLQIDDEVLVYVDPKRPGRVFIDWATLTSGGRRAPGSVTIDGEVLGRRDADVSRASLRPANDA